MRMLGRRRPIQAPAAPEPTPLERMRAAFVGLAIRAGLASRMREVRGLVVGAAHGLRTVADARAAMEHLATEMTLHADEVATWVAPDALARGEGGPFDACDLRHWLALAERAGVPFIPAREILELTEDEYASVCGEAGIPDTPSTRRLRRVLVAAATAMRDDAERDGEPLPEHVPSAVDPEDVRERLAAAMDDVPEGWMVRLSRIGGSNLKSLAGFGLMDETAPEVRFGPGLEVGPGWVRIGNRRMVDAVDDRTMDGVAQGPGPAVFLARPWQVASRHLASEDPHRHGTPFAGKGVWPAEWRAIVRNGVVEAVASYYGWADTPTPESARQALAVRERAQRIVDEATAQRAWPRFWDAERRRRDPRFDVLPGYKDALDAHWGREMVSCTLDFVETDQGPMLLEGGPAVSPAGGGHPCAFAGAVNGREGTVPLPVGVAFRAPEGVLVGDPTTWDGPHADVDVVHLPWERVAALVAEERNP